MIAFAPQADQFGSWQWIGQDLAGELGPDRATTFIDVVPECDVVVFIKFKPPAAQLKQLRKSRRLIYCPVDFYGSAAEIDADWESLRKFDCDRAPGVSAETLPVTLGSNSTIITSNSLAPCQRSTTPMARFSR